MTSDCISREQAIRAVKDACLKVTSECESRYDEELNDYVYADTREIGLILKVNKAAMLALKGIPPVDAVPVEWIRDEIDWIKGSDNVFAKLGAGQLEAMLKRWKDGDEHEAD